MTIQGTPMIPVEKIVVEEGLNPRKSMDPEALKRLGESMSSNEFIQPITVRPSADGNFTLLAGGLKMLVEIFHGRQVALPVRG